MSNFSEVGVEAVVKGVNTFVRDLGKMSKAATDTSETIGDGFDEAAGRFVDANGRLREANGRFVKTTNDAGDSVKGFGTKADKTSRKLGGFGGSLNVVKGITDTVKNSIGNLTNIITTGLGVALGNIITGGLTLFKNMITGISQSIVTLGKESVSMAADFQDQVAILGVSARDSGLAFEELKAAALAVGGDVRLVGVSATGAADAMTNLFKAGLNTNLVFGDLNAFMEEGAELGGALRASIDLAAASELDMASAAELSAIVLASFGSELESDAEKAEFINLALNNFVQAADASVAEVGGLADALKNVGPTAAAAGFDLFEINNALAILSTRGIVGAEAGTALKSAIANMRRPTAAVVDELDKWGISLFDSEGNMFSLVEIIGQFEIAMEDATDKQRAQAIQTIAGTFGMNAMNALLAEGVDGWVAMAEATGNAATIQDQAAVRAATFSGQMEALEGVLETLKIQIGDALLPVGTELVTWLTGIIDTHGPMMVETIQSIGAMLSNFAGFILGVIEDGDTLNDFLANFPSSIQPFIQGIGEIVLWLQTNIPIAIQTASEFWTSTLVPALTDAWTFISTNILPVFAEIWTWLQTNIPIGIQTLSEFWTNTLMPALQDSWTWIETNLIPVFTTIQEWLALILPIAIDELSTWWNDVLLPALVSLQEQWTTKIQPALAQLFEWLQERVPQAIETAKDFWENVLKPALQTIGTFIAETLIPIMADIVVFLAENIPVAIDTAVQFWQETLKPALETVWQFISDNIIPVFETVVAWLQENIPLAIEEARRVWEEVLQPALELVWGFIEEDLVPLFEALDELLGVTLAKTLEALTLIWEETLKPALEAVWKFIDESILPIFDSIIKKIEEDLSPVLDTLSSFLTDTLKKGFEGIRDIIGTVTEKIGTLIDKIKSIDLTNLFPFIGESPSPLERGLTGIAKAMGNLSSVQLPRFAQEIAFAGVAGSALAGPVMSAGNVMTTNVTNNFNTNVNGPTTGAAFQQTTLNTVNRALASGVG